jgi:hypothetical protein
MLAPSPSVARDFPDPRRRVLVASAGTAQIMILMAVLVVLKQLYGSLQGLGQQDIYLAEALTGFALWLRRQTNPGHLTHTGR